MSNIIKVYSRVTHTPNEANNGFKLLFLTRELHCKAWFMLPCEKASSVGWKGTRDMVECSILKTLLFKREAFKLKCCHFIWAYNNKTCPFTYRAWCLLPAYKVWRTAKILLFFSKPLCRATAHPPYFPLLILVTCQIPLTSQLSPIARQCFLWHTSKRPSASFWTDAPAASQGRAIHSKQSAVYSLPHMSAVIEWVCQPSHAESSGNFACLASSDSNLHSSYHPAKYFPAAPLQSPEI